MRLVRKKAASLEYDYQITRLSDAFYDAYPYKEYSEIMQKDGRAYNCLLVDTHYDFFICIPYRTHIPHENGFHFKKSERSKKNRSGLDYSKMVIVTKQCYISDKEAVIDKDEYNETVLNINKIVEGAVAYIEAYIEHTLGKNKMHPRCFERCYGMSTLKYFHEELGII